MSGRSKILVVLTLSAALATWLVWRDRVPERRSVTLADGSIVRVKQVSFANKHFAPDVPTWERLLWTMPTNLASRFGVKARPEVTTNDTLVLWIEWRHGSNLPRFLHSPRVRLVERNGLPSTPIDAHDGRVKEFNTVRLYAFNVDTFPRDEGVLMVDLSASDPAAPNDIKQIGTFIIRNPAYTKRKPRGPVFPASRDIDGERFALAAIHTGLFATGSLAGIHGSNPWTELVFRIGTNASATLRTNVGPQGDWTIHSVQLRDGYGNEFEERDALGLVFPLGKEYISRNDDEIALIRAVAWPGVRWNVRAVLQRNFTRSFDPRHSWTTSVPVPRPGETNLLQQIGHVDGCSIGLHSIWSVGRSPPILNVRFRGKNPSYKLSITHVEDQRGSNVVWSFRGSSEGESMDLHTAPEAKEVRITFGVAHPVVVELSGTATLLRTNVAYRAESKRE